MATLNVKNVPDRLYRRLQARARQQLRSVAQEVIHILRDAVEEPEPRSILELRGLGKGRWKGIDPDRHVARERRSWR
jgi:plasmid stability protein